MLISPFHTFTSILVLSIFAFGSRAVSFSSSGSVNMVSLPITTLITDWIHAIAGSPLVLAALALLCFVDAFFPPLPSESIVIGLSSWYFASEPGSVVSLPLIFLTAVTGAFLGDLFAFFLGTKIPIEKLSFLQRGKGQKAYAAAQRTLHRRGTTFIFCARFIPIGRVAVNICAGATNFGWKRFLRTDFAAVFCWVAYGILIGAFSGKVVGTYNPLLAVVVGIVLGLALSLATDRLVSYIQRRIWDKTNPDFQFGDEDQNSKPEA